MADAKPIAGTRPFTEMMRIEGRITPEQYGDLTQICTSLRLAGFSRISNNILIRVALTGLLQHSASLTGTTEESLTDNYLAILRGENNE